MFEQGEKNNEKNLTERIDPAGVDRGCLSTGSYPNASPAHTAAGG
jgi:hypothetical protein